MQSMQTVLVVDDSADDRQVLASLLGQLDRVSVISATSAAAALAMLDGSLGIPGGVDVILMAVRLPDLDGLEACRHIRATPGQQDIPLIVVTPTVGPAMLRDAFEAGATDFLTKPFNNEELLIRVRTALVLKREIEIRRQCEADLRGALAELERLNRRLESRAALDGLTGVPNRRSFQEALAVEWLKATQSGQPLSLVMIDVDFFKTFNDCLGHLAGDDCLIQVAQTLAQTVENQGYFARFGGEEFIAILPNADEAEAMAVARQLHGAVAALAIPLPGTNSELSVSIGVATTLPANGTGPDQLVAMADRNLYAAKAAGRNQVFA